MKILNKYFTKPGGFKMNTVLIIIGLLVTAGFTGKEEEGEKGKGTHLGVGLRNTFFNGVDDGIDNTRDHMNIMADRNNSYSSHYINIGWGQPVGGFMYQATVPLSISQISSNITVGISADKTIISGGKVGIGTATPYSKLTVKDGAIRMERDGAEIVINSNNGTSSGYIGTYNNTHLHVGVSNSPLLTLNTSGNVGIGKTTPSEKLEVAGGIKVGNSTGTNAGTIRFSGSQFEGYDGSNWIQFAPDGSPVWSLNGDKAYYNNGKVGIGESNPTELLVINGNNIRSNWVSLIGSGNLSGLKSDRTLELVGNDDGLGTNEGIVFKIGGIDGTNEKMRIKSNGDLIVDGNLSLGTDNPQEKLSVAGNIIVADKLKFAPITSSPNDYIINTQHVQSNKTGLSFFANDREMMRIGGARHTYINDALAIGNVHKNVAGSTLTVSGATHIGPADFDPTPFNYTDNIANYLLWVENGIVSEDFALAAKADWSDFVFEEGYDLTDLEQVEDFIKANKHLPNFPSAKQISEEGYTVHDMNKRFLQQVEELTLHAIAQEKKIKSLQQQLSAYESLATEVAALKKKINK